MKDIIQKIRSGTPNLKLICEAITQTKLSLDAAQNSLQSMIDNVVPPECTSVAVQTDLCLISSEGNEIVYHPFLKTSPQNNMEIPEQREFEFHFEKHMLPRTHDPVDTFKELEAKYLELMRESSPSSDFEFQEASSTCLNGDQMPLEKLD